MPIYSTLNLTNSNLFLILKNLWSPAHQLVGMTQQLPKHMRTNSQFLLDHLSMYTSSKLLPNCSSHHFQRPYLLTGQCRWSFRF